MSNSDFDIDFIEFEDCSIKIETAILNAAHDCVKALGYSDDDPKATSMVATAAMRLASRLLVLGFNCTEDSFVELCEAAYNAAEEERPDFEKILEDEQKERDISNDKEFN